MKKITYYLFFILTALFISCSEDLLDFEQKNVFDANYYSKASDTDAQSLIAALYFEVINTTGASNYIAALLGCSGDGYVGSTFGDTPEVQVLGRGTATPAQSYSKTIMPRLYKINYWSNMIIENMNENTPERTIVKGEAFAIRAWAYFHLIGLFGNPPLVDHVLGSDELQPANASTEDLWNYVISSLDEAIQRLPSKGGKGNQASIGGRLTKEAAMAIKGKAQVYNGDFPGAVTTLQSVIATGYYDLIDNYSDLWRPAADYSDEYLWEYNSEDTESTNQNSQYPMFMWVDFNGAMGQLDFPYNSPIGRGFATNYTPEFGQFMKDYDYADDESNNRYSGTIRDYDEMIAWCDEARADGISTVGIKGGLGEKSLLLSTATHCAGYFQTKIYYYSADNFVGMVANSKANWPYLRYSEVLLLYAEACLETNQMANGLPAFNAVHERAGHPAHASYDFTDIVNERRAELVLENGSRYFDLVRWSNQDGDFAIQQIGNVYTRQYYFKGYNADGSWNTELYTGNDGVPFSKKHLHWPYPESETNQNPNIIQNFGY